MNQDNFEQILIQFAQARDTELRQLWNRSLPFSDATFDRWERAKRLGFGDRSSIYNSACVFGDVTVGEDVWIGPNVILDGIGNLKIGNSVSVSAGVQIYTHDTVLKALSGGLLPIVKEPVDIADCVYIGSQSIITKGVKIGRKSVISANSLVLHDVAEGVIVGGSPAVIIGYVYGDGANIQLNYIKNRADPR